MRSTPLLAEPPSAIVNDLAELYAIALMQAETAASRYDGLVSELTDGTEGSNDAVRDVFATLGAREWRRVEDIRLVCSTSTNKPAVASAWRSADLIASDELSDLAHSALATPYQAWAVAVRHRQRAFIFWTYVAAQATRPNIQSVCETMAREALADADQLRRERRSAWRSARAAADAEPDGRPFGELSSAALIESLLFKEVVRWAQALPATERDALLLAAGYSAAELAAAELEFPAAPDDDTLDAVRQRTIRYAEQVTMIYLDEADQAADQTGLDLAQKLASSSIARLARLRSSAFARQH
ncbi:MAG: hypothetical protein HZA66_14100 [Rhodopseudomonas palustris]|uniref:Uncharacterized protein n=1 Tax=Rhodopseudomonas palustris TaxID=1076 RepID=A0A933W2S0_RHOPL|nr:hypothetical protein [Rhodopseudomonas palustris]